mmetsp:Transcript_127869/g.368269  ORF Transcript_127869/g.368269 Transcript_127869/m.368269 type:complete len:303 (-) Transcript_127869:307-1215(-)
MQDGSHSARPSAPRNLPVASQQPRTAKKRPEVADGARSVPSAAKVRERTLEPPLDDPTSHSTASTAMVRNRTLEPAPRSPGSPGGVRTAGRQAQESRAPCREGSLEPAREGAAKRSKAPRPRSAKASAMGGTKGAADGFSERGADDLEIPTFCFSVASSAAPGVHDVAPASQAPCYRERRDAALMQQRFRDSIAYSRRRETAMAVAVAAAMETGQDPKFLSYSEFRKSISYAARKWRSQQALSRQASPEPEQSPKAPARPDLRQKAAGLLMRALSVDRPRRRGGSVQVEGAPRSARGAKARE